jgi:hypothetical protein
MLYTLISGNINLRTRNIIIHKEGYFTMKTGIVHKENITILKMYTCNNKILKFMNPTWQK